MSKIEKDSIDVLSELWAIADEVGHDYVYEEESCSYVAHREDVNEDGECVTALTGPGCIVGHWLHGHGVSLGDLSENEGAFLAVWPQYKALVNFDLTQTAVSFLREVQRRQDRGVSWGRSIQEAAATLDLI